MKIILFSRPSSSISSNLLGALIESIEGRKIDYAVDANTVQWLAKQGGKTIDNAHTYSNIAEAVGPNTVVISYGGDGTLLSAVRALGGARVPVMGINSGRLGFLATVGKNEFETALDALQQGSYRVEERALLKVEGQIEGDVKFPLAVNEFSIQRQRMSMVGIKVEIDNHTAAEYWSDGALVATPTGSTAYSLSAGGPIVAPNCNCLILTPIAPHNLTIRPLIIPDNSQVKITIETRDGAALASIDNETFSVENGATFVISKAEEKVFLVVLQNILFYDTLKNKMMWGIDGRTK